MENYRYYLIADAMTRAFPQKFKKETPFEYYETLSALKQRYLELRDLPYNNEQTWNEKMNLPYARLTVGVERADPKTTVTVMEVRGGVNYLSDDYRSPFGDTTDKQLLAKVKELVEAVGVDRIRPHLYKKVDGHVQIRTGSDRHITDWAYVNEMCSNLHFSRFLNHGCKEMFLVRNGQQVIETRADGTQQTKAVKNVDSSHLYVGHQGYHVLQYADLIYKAGIYVTPLHPQPGDLLDKLQIFQSDKSRFESYDSVKGKLQICDFHRAYVGNMPQNYTPDKCYQDFNADNRPCPGSMRSLSVGDIVVMQTDEKETALYVDTFGFKDVGQLLPGLHAIEVRQQPQALDEPER